MQSELQQTHAGGADLFGARILIVEDQFEVAEILDAAVTEAGGQVVAIARTIDEALAVIRTEAISAAIITMIADGIYTDMVARELTRHGAPFAVTTGIGTSASHPELHGAPTIIKPFQTVHVQAILADLLATTRPTAAG